MCSSFLMILSRLKITAKAFHYRIDLKSAFETNLMRFAFVLLSVRSNS